MERDDRDMQETGRPTPTTDAPADGPSGDPDVEQGQGTSQGRPGEDS